MNSEWVETGLPCPCGVSSDAFATASDGHGYCFRSGCKSPYFSAKVLNNEEEEDLSDERYSAKFYPHRGISSKTFERFNVMTKFFDDDPLEVGFIYPNGSIKIRGFEEKKFRSQGDMKNATLFGKNVFDKGSRRAITITEGEYDTLAASEILGNDSVVVSVRSASSAKHDCKLEYDYINSFEKIVINFDNDEPGQDAAKKVASLFDYKKVFNLVLEKHKDANAYLEAGEGRDYYQAWRSARRYTPDSLLSTLADFKKALAEKSGTKLADYPFKTLQDKLHGLHEGEVVIIKAEEGVGKSEVFRAIENHVLKTTNHTIGIIHLEESNGTTLRAMAGYFSESPVLSPDMPTSDEDVLDILEDITGSDGERFILHSSFDVDNEDAFTDNVRFMVAAGGCKIVFFDHISWLATGSEDKQDDERRRLDRISQKLKLMAEELNFCLVMISHVNDDGKTRGSRYITKVANTVLSLFRDKTNPDNNERIKTHFMIEKARMIGAKEGPGGYAIYDEDTLMLRDPPKNEGISLPK